jgi:hypothetical protein
MSETQWKGIRALAVCLRRALLMIVGGLDEFLKIE